MNMKQITKQNRRLLSLSALLLAAGCLGLSLFPAPRFSETENRMLAELPTVSAEKLADGTLTAALDTYAAERMPLRRELRHLRAAYHLALGEGQMQNILLCRDGSLTRRGACSQRALSQNLAVLTALSQKWGQDGVDFTLAVAPRRVDARKEVLPRFYDTTGDLAVWQRVCATLPQAVCFEGLSEDIYWYRTDHHWTTHGAYAAYVALADKLGYTPFPAVDFKQVTVSKAFYGTSHAAAGIPFIRPDSIVLYRFAGDGELEVRCNGVLAPFAGLYDTEKLQTRDGYGIFLGGNHGVVEIGTGEGDTRPVLTVIKDSFANALLPFLARHFRIVAVDPRYAGRADLSLLQDAEHVLFLCGMQTLTDSFALKPLQGI